MYRLMYFKILEYMRVLQYCYGIRTNFSAEPSGLLASYLKYYI